MAKNDYRKIWNAVNSNDISQLNALDLPNLSIDPKSVLVATEKGRLDMLKLLIESKGDVNGE
jgi:hypothetical protein